MMTLVLAYIFMNIYSFITFYINIYLLLKNNTVQNNPLLVLEEQEHFRISVKFAKFLFKIN